ncbi:cupin domain-containing protein, partial [Clostridium perfringens]|nr:cupin domain-containing protein [Clostridium perfringens]
QHQKVRQIREGDVIALPAGVAHWIYNRGQSNLVLVSLYDVGNAANQLDQLFRKFFLAGSPPQEFQGGSQSQSQRGRSQGPHQEQGRQQEQRRHRGQGQEQSGGNIFSGFNQELLAEALNIDTELVNRLQR